jgi:phage virion morphogenesis protein
MRVLEQWAGALLARLEPAERRRLNQSIAQDLRRAQRQRIAAQRNPDGSPFAPRKERAVRGKQGRIKRKMFTRLRTATYLKLQSDPNAIAIGFLGRAARIARVHQYGLPDRPGRNTPDVQYEKRELLGFSAADRELIRDRLTQHLASL